MYYTNKAISLRKRTEEYKKVPTWYLPNWYRLQLNKNSRILNIEV